MECDLLKGHKCYYDGTGIGAEKMRNVMLARGSDGVWEALESYYQSVFEKGDAEVGFGELLNAFANAIEGASNEKAAEKTTE